MSVNHHAPPPYHVNVLLCGDVRGGGGGGARWRRRGCVGALLPLLLLLLRSDHVRVGAFHLGFALKQEIQRGGEITGSHLRVALTAVGLALRRSAHADLPEHRRMQEERSDGGGIGDEGRDLHISHFPLTSSSIANHHNPKLEEVLNNL